MLKEGVIFLNHGSFGATPRVIFDAQDVWRRKLEAEPIELLGRQNFALLDEAKKPIAAWLGVNPADIGFVTNATEGINAVLRSIDVKPGEELLTTNHVYHAVRQAMRITARRAGGTLREVDIPLPVQSADQIARLIIEQLTPRTRLVLIDHVTSPTALVFPVEKVIAECRRRGVEILIDGAHAPGMIPLHIDKLGATYYAANLHKWACGPKGSAFIWVRPDRQTQTHPAVISHWLDDSFRKEFGWQGTRDISPWLTVPQAAGISRPLRLGQGDGSQSSQWRSGRIRLLCRAFEVEPISPLDGSMLGSTASDSSIPQETSIARSWPASVEALQQRLYSEFQIEVPLMLWNNQHLLRVSCQIYNEPSDYQRLAEVITSL